MPRIQSAIEQVRLHGLLGVWGLLRSNIYAPTTCLRLQKDLHQASSALMPAKGCLRLERGDLAQLAAWRGSRTKTLLPMDFYADRTHRLRQFYLGYWNGEVAHILWLAGEGEPSTISDWQLRAQEVELRNVHTLGEFRRRGIFRNVAQAVLKEIREQGIRMAYAHVEEHNSASLEGFLRLGFRPTHRIRVLRVLGRDWIRQMPIEA